MLKFAEQEIHGHIHHSVDLGGEKKIYPPKLTLRNTKKDSGEAAFESCFMPDHSVADLRQNQLN